MPTSSRCIASRRLRSSAESGSSSSSSRGRFASARASATRARWPPESCDGRQLAEAFQPHQRQHRRDPRRDLAPGHAVLTQAEGDIAGNIHVREQRDAVWNIMFTGRAKGRHGRDVLAVEQDAAPASGCSSPARQAQQRRLAAAGAAEQREQLALADGEVHAVERRRLAGETLAQAFQPQQRTRAGVRPRREGYDGHSARSDRSCCRRRPLRHASACSGRSKERASIRLRGGSGAS